MCLASVNLDGLVIWKTRSSSLKKPYVTCHGDVIPGATFSVNIKLNDNYNENYNVKKYSLWPTLLYENDSFTVEPRQLRFPMVKLFLSRIPRFRSR